MYPSALASFDAEISSYGYFEDLGVGCGCCGCRDSCWLVDPLVGCWMWLVHGCSEVPEQFSWTLQCFPVQERAHIIAIRATEHIMALRKQVGQGYGGWRYQKLGQKLPTLKLEEVEAEHPWFNR